MNHSINKWQQNKPKCIQGSLSGTERCDSWHLSSYRYSLSPVCLFTLSPSLSCTLHPLSLSPTESGWPGMSSPTDSTASHSQTGAVCNALDFRQSLGGVSRGLPPWDHYHSTIQMYGQRLKTTHLRNWWVITFCHSANHSEKFMSVAAKSISSEWCTAVSFSLGHTSNYL